MKSTRKSNKKDLAMHELYVAIDHFAYAMENADVSYIAQSVKPYPFTLNMEESFTRYVLACRRLKELDGQKA